MRRSMVMFCGLAMTAIAMVAGGTLSATAAHGFRTDPASSLRAASPGSPDQAGTLDSGYVLAAADGGVFTFGRAFDGSAAGLALRAPIAGIASTPDGGGYWLTAADGGVFAYGDAHFYGSMTGTVLNNPVEGIAATPDGGGYWLVASDGGVFAFGDARYYGRLNMPNPVVGIASTGDGKGYWVMTDTGGAFAFGDAMSVQEAPRSFAYVAIARVGGTTRGIALLDVEGTRYTFNATAAGCPAVASLSLATNAGMVGIATVGTHCGELLAGWDGGVFAFGTPFLGSAANVHLAARIVGITS